MLPEKLHKKLEERIDKNAFRELSLPNEQVDFSSNDYLGLAKSKAVYEKANDILNTENLKLNGATGSRLLSGNHQLYTEVEKSLCELHQTESALIFNSGYDANIGFFSSVLQKGDIILYDEYIHASIRDGIRMSHAKSYKFKHNDVSDLSRQIERNQDATGKAVLYVVTESVFSMDGDIPDLKTFATTCEKYSAYLIIDEAHALGVFGTGLVEKLNIVDKVFARIITFGKALGCHGAAVLGSADLKNYLVNFSRSFIYTTGLPPHSLATIRAAYRELEVTLAIDKLHQNISFFKNRIKEVHLEEYFIQSKSAIHCCIIPGNEIVREIANNLQRSGFDVRPILSPTVQLGQERLRFCIHSYNSEAEIKNVLNELSVLIKEAI
ncbi:aminotransferase class I/II-fold pyridoxal phosphate-dependent enzyme [Flavobacteriaceae bacterium R38]|nr:aminotransferase class I/II-fold pyridoxal phosphate-dependent enzyme [Flavobacteriaceae bacterium R38]